MDSKKKKLVLLTLILAFVALLISAYVIYERLGETVKPNQLEGQEHEESQADNPEKEKAYDFTVYDIEGNEVHLSDYLGTPIVLNFWASWCGPCQREMPDFQEKYLEWGNEIQFLMVNMTDGSRETVDIASAFIEEQEYTFPVFYDTEYDASNTYGVYSLPMTVLIDSEGYIAGYASGAIDGETLQIGIDMIKE